MNVIKRNGNEVQFDIDKIITAISKANNEVPPIHQLNDAQIRAIAANIEKYASEIGHAISVEDIQDLVETGIMEMRGYEVAQKYVRYRYTRELSRRANTTDEAILSIIDLSNEEAKQENSNKNPIINSTQRDYMAGEVSRDLTERVLLPEDIVKAHKEGIIHFHDTDYYSQKMHNCCLINLEDMLQNGTVISGTMIRKPHSFYTACNITTQIIAQVASNQYGGQTFTLSHLAPFVEVSRQKITKTVRKEFEEAGINADEKQIESVVKNRLSEEIRSGIQTIQYQLVTLMTCNGQAPFVTMFMYLDEVPEGRTRDDLALIIEEALHQRIKGTQNPSGAWVTPAFPKIVYVLDEDNIHEDSKYYYLTELAAKCTAKRMVPDYISAKVMKKLKNGDIYGPMGCVEGSELITYQFHGETYVESFRRMWTRLSDYFKVKSQNYEADPNKYMDLSDVKIYDTKKGFVACHRIIRNVSDNWCKVKLGNGRVITCTTDHPFETENRGMVHAKDLTEQDVIRINKTGIKDIPGKFTMIPEKAWTYGVLLCDGCYDKHLNISIAATGEDEIENAFSSYMNEYFNLPTKTTLHDRGIKGTYKDVCVYSDGTNSLIALMDHLIQMFGGTKKIDRHIPNEVFSWTREAQIAFLAGMIDADGYLNTSSETARIQIGSTNKELALQQLYLAQQLGMPACMYENYYRSNMRDKIRYRVEFVPTAELIDACKCTKKKNLFVAEHPRLRSDKDVVNVTSVEMIECSDYSYDVTTESEHFEVSGIYSHNCRSFLTPDKEGLNPDGSHKYYGRFNQGVVTINLVDVACSSGKDMDKFWQIFEERLELCHRALRCRHERLLGTVSDVAPILWQYGALARLQPGETIDKLLYNNYSTISLGYAGLYECVYYMLGLSHTTEEGRKFGLAVMQKLNDKCAEWRAAENISYSVYGTPIESTTYKFAKCLQKRFGIIPGVTDKNYITNSYHVHVEEHIDAFSKLTKEAAFQELSPGGAISYVEVPNMQNNIPAVLAIMRHIYDTILYAELNTKSDYCSVCGYDGEIQIVEDENKKLVWECPNCGNRDQSKMSVARRTCGYIGTQYWNQGRTQEIRDRFVHVAVED